MLHKQNGQLLVYDYKKKKKSFQLEGETHDLLGNLVGEPYSLELMAVGYQNGCEHA